MKKITLLLALFVCWQINAQSIVIGTATTTTSSTGSDPIDGYFNSFRYQVVYTAAELSASLTPYDEITALGFSIAGDYAGGDLLGYTIKMGHTAATNSAAHDNSFTTIVKGPFSYNPTVTAEGVFDMITFDSNFIWNGVDNVLVEICSDGQNPFSGPYGQVRVTDAVADGSRYFRADGAPSCGELTNNTNTNKPNIQFNYIEGTPPACLAPSGLVSSAVAVTTATISWTASGSAPVNGYDYYYSTSATAPNGLTTPSGSVGAGVLTANLIGLTSNTTYYYWVRSNCGALSTWYGSANFRTLCASLTVPFTETFNSDSTTEACWAVLNANADGDSWNMNYAFDAFEGDQVAVINTDFNNGANNDWLISPTITLAANQRLRFRYRVESEFEPNDFQVLLSTTGAAPASFTNVLIPNASYSNETYAEAVVSLAAYSGDVNIAWYVAPAGLDGWVLYIDSVIIETIPVSPPTCSTISTPADAALDVAIDTNISWAANIDATGYYLQIGYSSGGSEILVNTDLGNVLTYNPPVDFDYSTTYFATLIPYNANGNATGCVETSFTTRDEPPVGSTCSNPIVVNPATLPYTTTDNTNLYGDDYSTSPCSDIYMEGDDVVYTISPATNMSVDILLSGLTDTYSAIHVLDGCPNVATTCVAYQGNSGTGNRDLQDVLLTGGTTYYIVISTWPAPQSVGYTLTITENTCVNPTVTFSSPNNCPTTNFNAVANITNLGSATSLTVTDNQGSPSQNVTATGNITFGPFAFGTNVVLTVTNNQDGTCNVVSSNLTVAACPPSNDDCASAIVLTPGGVFATYQDVADNTAATGSSQTAPTCASYSGQDVWYTVTVPASGSITIETASDTGSPITDTGLAVYSGTCAGVTQLGCDDDTGTGNFSLLSFTGRTPGEVLLVRAWEFGGGTEGTFLISAYDASLSSSSFDNNSFMAYPNPVKDMLNLSYTSEISNVQVVNMLGQVVLDRKMNATEGQIDMTGLNSGAYIVNVTVGDTVKAIKVIKQ